MSLTGMYAASNGDSSHAFVEPDTVAISGLVVWFESDNLRLIDFSSSFRVTYTKPLLLVDERLINRPICFPDG